MIATPPHNPAGSWLLRRTARHACAPTHPPLWGLVAITEVVGLVGRDNRRVTWDGPLPEKVRLRVVSLASDTLGALSDDEVPSALRKIRGWVPSRRTKLAATPLAAAVEHDAIFRQRVAARLRTSHPELVTALGEGAAPAAADPIDVAAGAYLLRPDGWQDVLARAAADLASAASADESARAEGAVAELQAAMTAAREQSQAELSAVRSDLEAARAETAAVRRELREEKRARHAAERAAEESAHRLTEVETVASATGRAAESELRRAKARVAELETSLEAAKRAAREGRSLEGARVRLLLDTVVDAAAGLRRELALPPRTERPADFVDAAVPDTEGLDGPPERALLSDDPARLDQLLALPQVHLVVDGYNVTKTGYPDLPLEAQRARLVGGLATLAAQSGAEVTCCFDGAALKGRVPSMSGRGVRVLFSKPGETADVLIRRLVAAEPPGRPVVVVSSDREVADGVRRSGARPLSAAGLVRRLDRG